MATPVWTDRSWLKKRATAAASADIYQRESQSKRALCHLRLSTGVKGVLLHAKARNRVPGCHRKGTRRESCEVRRQVPDIRNQKSPVRPLHQESSVWYAI